MAWGDRHWASLLMTDTNKTFTWVCDDRIDLIGRAAEYFWCTYMPKVLSDHPATQYLMAVADKDGKRLEGGRLYKVEVPAQMSVKQFWALTVYDRATNSFIYTDEDRTTLSSYDLPKMKKNTAGGVTPLFRSEGSIRHGDQLDSDPRQTAPSGDAPLRSDG